jgi:hypothetical protein
LAIRRIPDAEIWIISRMGEQLCILKFAERCSWWNVYGGHRMGHRSTEYREEYEQNEVKQNRPLPVSTEVNKKNLLKRSF